MTSRSLSIVTHALVVIGLAASWCAGYMAHRPRTAPFDCVYDGREAGFTVGAGHYTTGAVIITGWSPRFMGPALTTTTNANLVYTDSP